MGRPYQAASNGKPALIPASTGCHCCIMQYVDYTAVIVHICDVVKTYSESYHSLSLRDKFKDDLIYPRTLQVKGSNAQVLRFFPLSSTRIRFLTL